MPNQFLVRFALLVLLFSVFTYSLTGCTISNAEYNDDLNELSLYVSFKVAPKKIRWKLMTLPENSNDRSSIPGPIFFESVIIVFEASAEDIKKIRESSAKLTTTNSIPVPSEFIKSWLPSETAKKLANKAVDQNFFPIDNIASTKTKAIDSFAVIDGAQITIYINYRNS